MKAAIRILFFCFSLLLTGLISTSVLAQEITGPTPTDVIKSTTTTTGVISNVINDSRAVLCTTVPSGMPGSCTDVTPDKTWADGDVWTNWCAPQDATVTGGASCTSSSSDITCTTGNSTSYWASFQYNSTTSTDAFPYGTTILPGGVGDMAGFKVRGSGTKGDDVFAQVYDASGCSIGGCQTQASNKDSLSLSGLGLKAGTTYYIRMWAESGNAGSPAVMSGVDVGCRLTNLTSNYFDNATQMCQIGQAVHATTNGATSQDGGAADCGFARDGPWGEVTFLSKCGAGKNINTNDSWYQFCFSTGGTTTVSTSNLSCKGSYGIQFWIMSDGTGGANNNNASNNDFCNGDGWVDGGSSYEFTMVDCSSPGTTANASLTVSLGSGCHYIMTDGYRADFCDFDMSISCATCIVVNEDGSAVVSANSGTDVTITSGSSTTVGGSPTASGGTSPYTYSWTCSPTPCNLSSTTTANPTASPTVTTTYYVTVTDGSGACIVQDQMVVTVGVVLDVSLTAFKASVMETDVKLSWTTLTEDKNGEFIIQRAKISDGSTSGFEDVGKVAGSGNSQEPKDYNYTDTKVPPGTYGYRLAIKDASGRTDYSGTIEVTLNPPSVFTVFGTVPNPFKDDVTIGYSVPQKASVQVRVYNVVGQEVYAVDFEGEDAGYHSRVINLSSLRQGVYVYKIASGGKSFEGKLVKSQ